MVRLGRALDEASVHDDDLKHISVNDRIRHQKKKKTSISAIAIHYFGIS